MSTSMGSFWASPSDCESSMNTSSIRSLSGGGVPGAGPGGVIGTLFCTPCSVVALLLSRGLRAGLASALSIRDLPASVFISSALMRFLQLSVCAL